MLRRQVRLTLRREHERHRLTGLQSGRELTRHKQIGRVIQTASALLAVQKVEIPGWVGSERRAGTEDLKGLCALKCADFDAVGHLDETRCPTIAATQAMKIAVRHQWAELQL